MTPNEEFKKVLCKLRKINSELRNLAVECRRVGEEVEDAIGNVKQLRNLHQRSPK